MGWIRTLGVLLVCGVGLAQAAPPAAQASTPPGMELQFDRLASALTLLSDADHKIVNDAVQLIREGQNVAALARLSALTHSNPNNSSIRILMAFTQLQLGNLTGAFEQAKAAHEAPNGNSYRCYFLARIAFLTGDKVTCRRELEHTKNAGDMPREVRQLENDMKSAKSKS
jgi:Flp pilus assembly protein TadD